MNSNSKPIINMINTKIKKLNALGVTVIFMIGGNNSSGKSTVSRKLLASCNFIQSINLGIISKMLRFFKKDLLVSNIENFKGKHIQDTFNKIIVFFTNHYSGVGVNTIFEGVQIDSKYLSKSKSITGGILLYVSDEIAIARGNLPETHFKRKLDASDMSKINLFENSKFKIINNKNNINETMVVIYGHLHSLLNNILLKYE